MKRESTGMDRRESTNESLEKNSKPYILTQIKSFNEHILTVSFRIMSSKNEQGEITLESEMFMNFMNFFSKCINK